MITWKFLPRGANGWRWGVRIVLTAAAVALLIAGYQLIWRYHVKRYQVVREGVLYRVAQPTEYGVHYLVERCGVKTVISLQLYRPTLKRGVFDPGRPNGREERTYVEELGANYLEWPQGEEACWPWPTPWMYEQYFALVDEPSNHPIAVHCMGGRHRTGTLSALYRLEYDRWPVERVLAEMYGFQFGLPISLHEHNLRTYLPRPHPSTQIWGDLQAYWQPVLASRGGAGADYEQLVRQLRLAKYQQPVQQALRDYLASDKPFALSLAQRVIDEPTDPLAELAAERASVCLSKSSAEPAEWAMAAALVADFGTPAEQRQLLELIEREPRTGVPSRRYHAVVEGVTNRYTRNRIAYLRPLLDDTRQRLDPAAARYRYCDTAMARLSVIIDTNLMEHGETPAGLTSWQYACQLAHEWIQAHDAQAELSQLIPPGGNNALLVGELPSQEDLRRMRK